MKKYLLSLLLVCALGCETSAVITSADNPVGEATKRDAVWTMDGGDSARRARLDSAPKLELSDFYYRSVYALKPDYEWKSGETSAPLVIGDVLVFGTSARAVRAIDWRTGVKIWEHKLRGPMLSSPAFHNNMYFVADGLGWVEGLDSKGEKVWETRLPAPINAPLVENSGRIYAWSIDQNLFCLDSVKGTPLWRYEAKQKPEGSIWHGSSPAVSGGRLFIGLSDGQVVALDAEYGRVLWKKTVTEKGIFTDVSAGPAVDGNVLYVGGIAGPLAAMNVENGDVIWKSDFKVTGGFALDAKKIYFGTVDGYFRAARKTDGEELWNTKLDKGVASQPVSAGNFIYVGSTEGGLSVIDAQYGQLLLTAVPGSGIQARPWIGEHGLAYISNAGVLHIYDRRP